MNIPRHILIFHCGPLGDFVLTWPLACALVKCFPSHHVLYVTHAQKGALAQRVLGTAWSAVESHWSQVLNTDGELSPEAIELLTTADFIFNFHTTHEDPVFQAARQYCPNALFVSLRPPFIDKTNTYFTKHFVAQLETWPDIHDAAVSVLTRIAHHGIGRRHEKAHRMIIHPGSSTPLKRWPLRSFTTLATRLQHDGLPVLIIVGAQDLARSPPQERQALAAVAKVQTPNTLLHLWEHLCAATCFLGNDSGPSHLAGILGLKTFCLFGDTQPAVWCPLGPDVHVRQHRPLPALGVEDVYEWIIRQLSWER